MFSYCLIILTVLFTHGSPFWILWIFCCNRESREQQRSQDGPAPVSRSRASDSGGDSRRTPPSSAEDGSASPSSKPGWTEESGSSWNSQANAGSYQVWNPSPHPGASLQWYHWHLPNNMQSLWGQEHACGVSWMNHWLIRVPLCRGVGLD